MSIVITSKSKAYIAAREKLGDHRKVVDSLAAGIALLKSIYATAEFPAEFPTVAAGVGLIDASGEATIPPESDWPEAYRSEGVMICISFLGVRGIKGEDNKESNGARAFCVYPLHSIDAIRSDESGDGWLWKVTEKESSHVALRGLRGVDMNLGSDALAAAAMGMPVTVSDYVEESTREGLDTSAFDKIWKQFRKLMSESPATAAMVPTLPTKVEVLRAIRSTDYAKREYADLEAIGAFRFIGETMSAVIDGLRAQAIAAGDEFDYDSQEIRGWLAGRDTKMFAQPRTIDTTDLAKKVDFSQFMTGGLALPQTITNEPADAAAGAQ